MVLLVIWIALGLIAGFVASKRFHHTATGLALDIALGVGGAIAGGLACYTFKLEQATAFLVASAVCAAIGSLATLSAYRSIFRPA